MAKQKFLNIHETADPHWIKLSFIYNAEMQHKLKLRVGSGNYRYENTIWLVRSSYYQIVIDLFKKDGYTVRSNVNTSSGSNHQQRSNYRPGRGHEEYRQRSRREFEDTWGDFFDGKKPQRGVTNNEQSWNDIFEGLEPQLAQKVYRRVASVLHPDVGGDTEAMKALNTAWTKFNDRMEVKW